MTSSLLTWTAIPSYCMTYAKALGYVFEIHTQPEPLHGRQQEYTLTCRHCNVVGAPHHEVLSKHREAADAQRAAESWLLQQIQLMTHALQIAA